MKAAPFPRRKLNAMNKHDTISALGSELKRKRNDRPAPSMMWR